MSRYKYPENEPLPIPRRPDRIPKKMRGDDSTITRRTLALVMRSPDGVGSNRVALVMRTSQASASRILSRLWWEGRVDRTKGASEIAFIYSPRMSRL